MFNYQNLEPGQFEELCRDIMQVKTGKQLHIFARGRDGGVDLTDDSNRHTMVVQVKHYEKSGYSALKTSLKKEVAKVRALSPKQYYVCISQQLTDSNVNEIYEMFSDYMESTNNIMTLSDIDSFLHDPKNIQITRNHTKLWLESGVTLQLLLECFPEFLEKGVRFFDPTAKDRDEKSVGGKAKSDHLRQASDLNSGDEEIDAEVLPPKMMTIVNENGQEEEVEVILAFEFTDTKKEYVIYTKNEVDKYNNTTVYISNIDRTGKTPVLMGVEDDSEWERIRDVLKKLGESDIDQPLFDEDGFEIL